MLESTTSGNLLTTESLRGICDLVDELILPHIVTACPGVSIASRLAELRGKTCSQLNDDDVSYAKNLLDKCAHFYKSDKLKRNATTTQEEKVLLPDSCFKADFVYNVMHYFADVGFYDKSHDLKHTIVYIHHAKGSRPVYQTVDRTFYEEYIESQQTIDNGIVRLVAVGFRRHNVIKDILFEKYLIRDLTYFGLAGLLIALFTLIYLLSFALAIGTLVNIPLSCGFAYFLYYCVCQMPFFPCINLLALLVLISVGADDVFVFYDTWLRMKAEHPTWTREQRMSSTFSHAIVSIFVTSFITAASFLANTVSNIIAIQCFGIFAALVIAANLAMMVTIMPAIVVASEACSACVNCPCCASKFGAICRIPKEVYSWVAVRYKNVFHTAIPIVISHAWRFCIAIGLAIGMAAFVIVFYKPALKPPSTQELQLFNKDNLLDKWDLDFKNRFPAEIGYANKQQWIVMTILFGFKATDPGNRLNPNDNTKSLSRDAVFYADHKETMEWLRTFCNSIQNTPFKGSHGKSVSFILSNYDTYIFVIDFACSIAYRMTPSTNKKLWYTKIDGFTTRCCGFTGMGLLSSCVDWLHQQRLMQRLKPFISQRIRRFRTGSPVYDKKSNDSLIFGYRLDVRTNLNYSLSYDDMRTNYDIMSSFMKTKLESAPDGLRSGIFSGFFEFYDLQHSLVTGTMMAVGLFVVISFLVLLITVRNVLITIYAMLTIVLSIACTVASIVLMGWKLNIVESITIMLAVGMSVDFTIHYSVVYQLSRETTAVCRTRKLIKRVGSALAAAAGTTFCAGVALLHCSIDPCRKLGVFLMLVVVFSWVYATFFFLSLCHAFGPVKGVCQIPSPITLIRPRKQPSGIVSL